MGDYRHKANAAKSWRILLAVACVLLVVVVGVVQVAHSHADRAATHADCGLCVAAHISVQAAYAPASAPPVTVAVAVDPVAPDVLPAALSTFALFTRPPPATIPAA